MSEELRLSPNEQWMRVAIEAARDGLAQGQMPFGAAIVRGDRLIASAHNIVRLMTDISAHAEVTAIRRACMELKTTDLAGCEIYSTCEPCPMCFGTIHFAKIDRVIFGSSIPDANHVGLSQFPISNAQMKSLGHSPVEIVASFMREQAIELFAEWQKLQVHE